MDVFQIVVSGLVASSLMILSFSILKQKGWQSVDLAYVLGRLAMGSKENASLIGLLIHYIFGMLSTVVYVDLLQVAPVATFGGSVILLSFVGVGHGVLAALIIMAVTTRTSTSLLFGLAGLGLFSSIILSHFIFGITLGIMLGLKGFAPIGILFLTLFLGIKTGLGTMTQSKSDRGNQFPRNQLSANLFSKNSQPKNSQKAKAG